MDKTTVSIHSDTKISATELARGLSDVLNRVKYRGERFVVIRNGEPIAKIEPTHDKRWMTLEELSERFANVQIPDDGFADDLEEIQHSQQAAEFPDWPS